MYKNLFKVGRKLSLKTSCLLFFGLHIQEINYLDKCHWLGPFLFLNQGLRNMTTDTGNMTLQRELLCGDRLGGMKYKVEEIYPVFVS